MEANTTNALLNSLSSESLQMLRPFILSAKNKQPTKQTT